MISRFTLGLLLGALLCQFAESAKWAVLVAGSYGWDNYRHQADVSHAYQIMRLGIPASNIITLMYDDIAYHAANPYKGVIINRPNGPNVYQGVFIDYRGQNVNSNTFLKVLSGDRVGLAGIGSGRSLQSTANDTVFVFFSDHGAKSLLAFPNDYLFADRLTYYLNWMSQNGRFKELIFYVEACYSGSMFEGLLPTNARIYVNTAANAAENSLACYCNTLNTCLGDVYSVLWMNNVESMLAAGVSRSYSLGGLFSRVKAQTTSSHVMAYGDMRYSTLTVDYIFGVQSRSMSPRAEGNLSLPTDAIPASDAALFSLREAAKMKKGLKSQYEAVVKGRSTIDDLVSKIAEKASKDNRSAFSEGDIVLKQEDFDCYRNLIDEFNKQCVNTFKNTYAVRHFSAFARICASSSMSETEAVKAMSESCTETHRALQSVV